MLGFSIRKFVSRFGIDPKTSVRVQYKEALNTGAVIIHEWRVLRGTEREELRQTHEQVLAEET
jgi:hypothetical protein